MVRKLGIYNGRYFQRDDHLMIVKLKNGIELMDGDIVMDDMIKDYKDPLWEKLVQLFLGRTGKNNGELADEVIELLEKEGVKING